MTEQELIANPRSGSRLDPRTRWSIYWLLAICSLAVVGARLWQVEAISYGVKVPFLSANDRSRWCTIRSLGDHGTYALDVVLQDDDGRQWDTIDKVLHWGRDFQPHFYSSKPTLLPTLLTYPYLALKYSTGWTLKDNTFEVVRIMLLTCQVLPLLLLFWAMGRTVDQVARTEWTRLFIMVSAAFGTFVTTFAITLTNHVPATVCAAVAVCALIKIWQTEKSGWGWFFLTGLAAAGAAATDLPAVALLLVCFTLCLFRNVGWSVLGFLPAAALVGAGVFATNYQAHAEWSPAYGHRSDGPIVNIVAGEFDEQLSAGEFPDAIRQALQREDLPKEDSDDLLRILNGGWRTSTGIEQRWIVFFGPKHEPVVLAKRSDGFGYEIRQWNNWYEYPGSYWLTDNASKSLVDRGEEQWESYLLHLTVGHHGAFSLTPIWLLSVAGILPLCFSKRYGLRLFGLGILAISVVVIAFYVGRPIEDRNYGGHSCAPRWLLWMSPLWFVAMIPTLDRLASSSVWRFAATLLLAASIASAFYAWTNPWVHPWLYELFPQWWLSADDLLAASG